MTRRKKSKSAGSGNGAVAVPAQAQAAPASANLQASAVGPNVTYTVPTCPRTGYCLLGPRPVYPVMGPRPVYPVQPSPAPRLAHLPTGPRPVLTSQGPRPINPVIATHPAFAPHTGKAPQPRTATQPMTAATGPQVTHQKLAPEDKQKTSSGDLRVKSSDGSRPVIASSNSSKGATASLGSSTPSEEASSVISVASTNTSDVKGKKKKQPYKVKVTYETKEINIYPRQPILMVERLQNLEYHVGELTEAVGRRPAVYPLGRRVRFVPETAAEGAVIQRYLSRIEAQERISWCSYSLPPGNSLKVTVKVKVVERIKITDDLAKLKLQEQTEEPALAVQKDSDVKGVLEAISKQNGNKDKKSAPKDRHAISSSENKDNVGKRNAIVNQISTSSSGQLDTMPKEKQQVAAKSKLGLTGSVQSTKANANPNKINTSAINPGRRKKHDNEPKKMTETEKTAAAVKPAHERDNKLRIVGVSGQINYCSK